MYSVVTVGIQTWCPIVNYPECFACSLHGLEAMPESTLPELSLVHLIFRHPLPQKCSSATEEVLPRIFPLLNIAGLSRRGLLFILLDSVQIRLCDENTSLHIITADFVVRKIHSILWDTRSTLYHSHRARGKDEIRGAETIKAWIFTMKHYESSDDLSSALPSSSWKEARGGYTM